MFQDLNKQLNASMGPLKALVEIQTRMLETLTRQQMECAKACVEKTLSQTQELSQCASPEEIVKLQAAYAHELEEALSATNSSNMEALNKAREEMESLTQSAISAFAPKK